jgi:hypothetical protein
MIGSKLAHYAITAHLGSGGMGEVYQATDSRLGRSVAIKFPAEAFCGDMERVTRFEREARVLASLNHPNIAAIFGLEESQGRKFLVMELAPGQTLAEKIAHGPIPIGEATEIAKQIAEAMEAAHDQGIIHRDLKPANIKVREDGRVKILDFGLAKAMERVDVSIADGSASPTMLCDATHAGIILGTAAYMSPEQARGKLVDKRADIWAFGCVLYEMLTGRRAFAGGNVTDILAAVVRAEPDWSLIPQDISPVLLAFLRRSLQKDLRQRLGDIRDFRLALEGGFEIPAPQITSIKPRLRSRTQTLVVVTVIAVLAGVLAAAAALRVWRGEAATPAATRLSVMLPANRPVSTGAYPTRALALSPDGTQLVYVATNLDASSDQSGGRDQLQYRSLDALFVRDLPGTIGAAQPFFSPDGQWVGFFIPTGEIKKVSLAGGAPVTVLTGINAARWGFGVWAKDNTIVFGTPNSGLRRVSAEGGEETSLTTPDAAQAESYHLMPALGLKERAVLFEIRYNQLRNPRIDAVMLESGERRVVLENAGSPLVLGSGHLLFRRDDTILIAPFDEEKLKVTGPAVPLVDKVQRDAAASPIPQPELAVSRNGTLAYLPAVDTASTLGLVSRDGAFVPLREPPGNIWRPRVSLDGRSVAFVVTSGVGSEIHVVDLDTGSKRKLTQGGSDSGVSWHPNNRSLAVVSKRKDASGIFFKNLDGGEQLLGALPGATLLRSPSWSKDGTLLAYTVQTGSQHDIRVLMMGDTPRAQPLINSPASEHSPKFSPDGRWIAYVSNESGRDEVYVRRYPQGERFPISTGGGSGPVWRPDGQEIFFQGWSVGVPKLIAVQIATEGDVPRLARPMPLFDLRMTGPGGVVEQYVGSDNVGAGYDILPDGKHFVMLRGADSQGSREIVLVQNWFEELKRLVPLK